MANKRIIAHSFLRGEVALQDTTLHIRHLGKQITNQCGMRCSITLIRATAKAMMNCGLSSIRPCLPKAKAGKSEHILNAGDIPVIQVDRGGQVTYHGPGQLVVYPLLDIKRSKVGVRQLVTHIEQSIVDMLAKHDINAYAKADAPGVYVDERKIAS